MKTQFNKSRNMSKINKSAVYVIPLLENLRGVSLALWKFYFLGNLLKKVTIKIVGNSGIFCKCFFKVKKK